MRKKSFGNLILYFVSARKNDMAVDGNGQYRSHLPKKYRPKNIKKKEKNVRLLLLQTRSMTFIQYFCVYIYFLHFLYKWYLNRPPLILFVFFECLNHRYIIIINIVTTYQLYRGDLFFIIGQLGYFWESINNSIFKWQPIWFQFL